DALHLLWWELVGDRPARRAAHDPEPTLLVEAVDLHDHAVRLVRQVVALFAPGLRERDHALDVQASVAIRVHGEAQGLQPGEGRRLGVDAGDVVLLDELVGPGAELPAGRDGWVFLAQRARAGVPRVGVERQAPFLAFGIDPGELGLRHEDL